MADIGKAIQLEEQARVYFYPYEKTDGEVVIVTLRVEGVTELVVRDTGTHRLKANGKLVIMPSGWLRIDVEAKDWTV